MPGRIRCAVAMGARQPARKQEGTIEKSKVEDEDLRKKRVERASKGKMLSAEFAALAGKCPRNDDVFFVLGHIT